MYIPMYTQWSGLAWNWGVLGYPQIWWFDKHNFLMKTFNFWRQTDTFILLIQVDSIVRIYPTSMSITCIPIISHFPQLVLVKSPISSNFPMSRGPPRAAWGVQPMACWASRSSRKRCRWASTCVGLGGWLGGWLGDGSHWKYAWIYRDL